MMKKISSIALLMAFTGACIGFITLPGKGLSAADAMEKKVGASENQESRQQKGHQIIAYYFHYKFRCPTCTRIEKLTQEAVASGFRDELKDGRLVLKIVNVDDKDNEHFLKDYDLQMQSVVIAETKDGLQLQWKNLDLIWDLVGDKQAFIKYIQDETRSYLGKG
ncbi:MAG TPA: nitrophenyl compound nitroreductase subunit ArsF family protein [Syntrophorhabdus sp.]|nr:nitrophenyl compound nitroreductase subunit ArsF family protein [Syntrophorhabdus sp.]